MKRSTKTTDRKKALVIAIGFERAATTARTVRQVQAVLSDISRDVAGDALPSIALGAFASQWLDGKRHTVAVATLSFYSQCVAKFLEYLDLRAQVDIQFITKGDIERFRGHEVARGLAPKTINHDLKCLQMLFKSARREGVITEDPCEFVDAVKAKRGAASRPTFTMEQVRRILSVAEGEWKSMVTVGLYTGQRLKDVATMAWSQIDMEKKEIRLTTSKTGKRLVIPMAAPLYEHLSTWGIKKLDAPLHPQAGATVARTGKTGGLSNQFASLLAKAGLKQKQPHRATHGKGRDHGRAGGCLSFHSLRHTAVTLLKEAGIPDAVVMAMIGHDDRAMSDHYTHVGREALRKAADVMPEI